MEKETFEHYKDRENTKINLVIYGSFGFSSVALYALASKPEASNIFVVTLFLLSLGLSLFSFFYWWGGDYFAYLEDTLDQNHPQKNAVREFQTTQMKKCFLGIISSYVISFISVLACFTNELFFYFEKRDAYLFCWIVFIIFTITVIVIITRDFFKGIKITNTL